jgi:Nucleotide exchange factor Fes1
MLIVVFLALSPTANATTENETLPIVIDSGAAGDPDSATASPEDVDLLKWALKHSDPESLHKKAQEAKYANKVDPDAAERRARAAELLQAVNSMPTESTLMEEAVLVLHNTSTTIEDKLAASEALIVLVEPIDNANDLLQITNATAKLVYLLGSAPVLEAAAARVLAVAASNNDLFSNELIKRHPDVILRLVQLLSASADDTVAAAVFAVGQLLRNSGHARSLGKQAALYEVLITMIRGGIQVSERSRKKAMTLAGDLVLLQNNNDEDYENNRDYQSGCSLFSNCESLISVLLDVLEEHYKRKEMDVDLVEKALLALQAAATAQYQESGGGGGGSGETTEEDKNNRIELVLGYLIGRLRKGNINGHVSEYAQDVIALAEQLLNTQSLNQQRDEL